MPVSTADEIAEEFGALHEREQRKAKLNQTLFRMGDLLNEWRPTEAQLIALARTYHYSVSTLKDRMTAAKEIPAEYRNPDLSFAAHQAVLRITLPGDDEPDVAARTEAAEQARWELLSTGGNITANQMRRAIVKTCGSRSFRRLGTGLSRRVARRAFR